MTQKLSLLLSFTLTLWTASCSDFPELEDTIGAADRAAAYPDLVNLDTLLVGVPENRVTKASADLGTRLAGLRSKANRLRGTVLTQAERQRLASGVAVPAAIR